MRKTKILCTMGPSSASVDVLKQMIRAGMDAARLNMAHGEPEDHAERIRIIREAARDLNVFIPVLMDIKGPEIRIGTLEQPSVELAQDGEIVLTTEPVAGTAQRIAVSYGEMASVVAPGAKILIDDGLIELSVVAVEGRDIRCRIVNGGELKPRKGVNLPGISTTLPGVTERDVRHILFGIEHGVDMIAVSFVRTAEAIVEVRRILEENGAGHVQVIAKIENEEGVANLDDIIAASDGIMVARGDLGVEIPVEEVPMVQREMIDKCNRAGKPVIVATHMLESMQVNPRPTRAEVSDVANAVLQGADVVMLSGESAAGKYPVESVATMATIAQRAEETYDYAGRFAGAGAARPAGITDVISQAAVSASLELNAKAILTPTVSGFTARMVAKHRPAAPIIAITPQAASLPALCLLRGVVPVLGDEVDSTDDMFDSAVRSGVRSGMIADGDFVVITAGVPAGKTGATNLIKVQRV